MCKLYDDKEVTYMFALSSEAGSPKGGIDYCPEFPLAPKTVDSNTCQKSALAITTAFFPGRLILFLGHKLKSLKKKEQGAVS